MKSKRPVRLPVPVRVLCDFGHGGGRLFGGPYRAWSSINAREVDLVDLFRIKLAPEVAGECDMVVPIKDFGVPPEALFKAALREAGKRLMDGRDVFVGCGFGIGRTGTFIAALCKLHREVLYMLRLAGGTQEDRPRDPVQDARELYRSIAVETPEQEQFVRALKVTNIARALAFRKKRLVVIDKRFWGF